MQKNVGVGVDIEVLVKGQPSTLKQSALSNMPTVSSIQTDIAHKEYDAVHLPKPVDDSDSTIFLLPPTDTPNAAPVSGRPPIAVIVTGVCSLCSLLALIFVIFGVVTKWFTPSL